MKHLILITLLLLSACTENKTPEVLPPVETKPTPEPQVLIIPAYKDRDCGNMVPEDFANIVKKAVEEKPALMRHNPDKNYWSAFFLALAKAESCLKPNMRYVEKGLGKDLVTGQQNTSEGYFQMSYQDAKLHGCAFIWSADKNLNPSDHNKTIFDVRSQIDCAAIVLNKQLSANPEIYRPYYWSVLDKKTPSRKEAHTKFLRYLKSEGF